MRTSREPTPWVPILAHWDITYSCNFRCSFCLTSSGAPVRGELSTSRAKALIDEMHEAGVVFLRVLGGEPFARRDIIEIFLHAASKDMLLSFSTNGTLITPAHAAALAGMRESLSYIQFSLHGADEETYEKVTGGPRRFERALEGLARLVESGLEVAVLVVATPENVHRLKDYYSICRRAGAAEVRVAPAVPLGRNEHTRGQPKADLWRALIEEAAEIHATAGPDAPLFRVQARPLVGEFLRKTAGIETYFTECLAGTALFFVDAAGSVAPCPFTAQRTERIRSAHPYLRMQEVGEGGLQQAWRSEVFERFRDHHDPASNPAIHRGCKYFREGGCLPCVVTPCECLEILPALVRPPRPEAGGAPSGRPPRPVRS